MYVKSKAFLCKYMWVKTLTSTTSYDRHFYVQRLSKYYKLVSNLKRKLPEINNKGEANTKGAYTGTYHKQVAYYIDIALEIWTVDKLCTNEKPA